MFWRERDVLKGEQQHKVCDGGKGEATATERKEQGGLENHLSWNFPFKQIANCVSFWLSTEIVFGANKMPKLWLALTKLETLLTVAAAAPKLHTNCFWIVSHAGPVQLRNFSLWPERCRCNYLYCAPIIFRYHEINAICLIIKSFHILFNKFCIL